jgi:hypothetical protein
MLADFQDVGSHWVKVKNPDSPAMKRGRPTSTGLGDHVLWR